MLVAWGELLSANSAPMVLLSKTHLSDKVLHVIAYMVVATIPVLLMKTSVMLICIGISEGTGIALECAQHYVPGRSTDIYDVVANTVGLCCAVGLGMLVTSRNRRLAR